MVPKENLLYTNLYTYCDNEPVLGCDPTGMGSVAFIGAGDQIEVIWFTSTRVNVKGKKRTIPYVYLYAGGGVSRSAKTTKMLKKLIGDIVKKPALLFNPKSLKIGGFSLSVCVFAIFGYSNFHRPDNYLKSFDEAYGSGLYLIRYNEIENNFYYTSAKIMAGALYISFSAILYATYYLKSKK